MLTKIRKVTARYPLLTALVFLGLWYCGWRFGVESVFRLLNNPGGLPGLPYELIFQMLMLLAMGLCLALTQATIGLPQPLRRNLRAHLRPGKRDFADVALGMAISALGVTDSLLLFRPYFGSGTGFPHIASLAPASEFLWITILPVFAAFTEETAWRGVAFPLMESHFGPSWAISVNALCFGLSHMLINSFSYSFDDILQICLLGFVLTAAYPTRRRLYPGFGLHWIYDVTLGCFYGISGNAPMVRFTNLDVTHVNIMQGRAVVVIPALLGLLLRLCLPHILIVCAFVAVARRNGNWKSRPTRTPEIGVA